ncbi:MAG: hypothetical protein WA862_13260 [Solirubrobacterales bacterium]
MLERLRTQIGTAGLIVAIVALVAALGGGAYAATGGSDGAKATASAKGKQGPRGKPGKPGKRGKTGPAGPAGPTGPAGLRGPAGANGAAGANGSAGAAGKSVVVSSQAAGPSCPEAGISVEVEGSGSKKFVCNGEEGQPGEPWTAGGTLPPGETETGVVSGQIHGLTAGPGASPMPISFPIPLASAPDPIYLEPGETSKVGCPGIVDGVPQADAGKLCVYMNLMTTGASIQGFFNPADPAPFTAGASKSGTTLLFGADENFDPFVYGVWAVTA